ncbi:protein of unknown function [Burkholderia multivorans]
MFRGVRRPGFSGASLDRRDDDSCMGSKLRAIGRSAACGKEPHGTHDLPRCAGAAF